MMVDHNSNQTEVHPRLEDIHTYWRKPGEAGPENATDSYTVPIGRSMFLIDKMKKHAYRRSKILEIGCNTGRNLAFLYHAGFRYLSAIEISEDAVENLRKTYRELKRVEVTVSPIEDIIKEIPDDAFDVVFTMAVLEHVHWDSDWIFAEIARIGRKVITIEDEGRSSSRHFQRNYQTVFENLGLHQVDYLDHVPDLPSTFRYRVFSHYRWGAMESVRFFARKVKGRLLG